MSSATPTPNASAFGVGSFAEIAQRLRDKIGDARCDFVRGFYNESLASCPRGGPL